MNSHTDVNESWEICALFHTIAH